MHEATVAENVIPTKADAILLIPSTPPMVFWFAVSGSRLQGLRAIICSKGPNVRLPDVLLYDKWTFGACFL
jgi:hypothetical protein